VKHAGFQNSKLYDTHHETKTKNHKKTTTMRTNNNVTRKNVLLLQTANGNMSFAQEGKHSETPILTAESLEGWKTATTQIETLLNPKVCGVVCCVFAQ
jgi:hypothetical protein